jgi:hypothetical protein
MAAIPVDRAKKSSSFIVDLARPTMAMLARRQ